MANDYVFGRKFEYDQLRTNVNISKVLSGRVRRKAKVKKRR